MRDPRIYIPEKKGIYRSIMNLQKAKCRDMFDLIVKDENSQQIASYSGYVPAFLPHLGGYGDEVEMKIDIETGRILVWANPTGDSKFDEILKDADKKVPKIISISAKCSDLCYIGVMDVDNKQIASHDGYVPSFMPNGGGYGDYVKLDIDIETGRILNWTNPIGTRRFNALLEGRDEDSD